MALALQGQANRKSANIGQVIRGEWGEREGEGGREGERERSVHTHIDAHVYMYHVCNDVMCGAGALCVCVLVH